MNTGIILGIHINFEKGIEKYGSVQKMPQYPIFEKFSKEGKLTVFTWDKKDFSDQLPFDAVHFRIYNKVLFMLMSWIIVSVIARRHGMEFLYYHSGSSIFALPFSNRISGSRTVLYYGVKLHINQHGRILRPLYYWFEKISMRWVDYIIACTRENDEFIRNESWFNGKFLPIPKFIRLYKSNKKFKKNPLQVIWVGRLDDVKDPISMICLWTLVGKKVQNSQLVMCGGGSTLRDIKLIARALNSTFRKHKISSKVIMTGQVHDIPKRLQESSILVSTSKYEGSPDNIIEGMSMGLPIVATDVGGTKDFVCNNWNGILIDREGSDWMTEMAKAIIWMLENPKIAGHMGGVGKELAWERHDMTSALTMLVCMMRVIRDSNDLQGLGNGAMTSGLSRNEQALLGRKHGKM